MKSGNCEYEVLNPWPEADPQPLKGLSPRITDMAGKTIGLLYNFKVAARPITAVIERRLKERFPTLKTSWHDASLNTAEGKYQGLQQEVGDRPGFADWVRGVDAVIAVVGD